MFGSSEAAVVCNLSGGDARAKRTPQRAGLWESQKFYCLHCTLQASSQHMSNRERRKHRPIPLSHWCLPDPPGETGLPGAIQEAKIPVGKIKLSSLMGKQRSLEPSLKFSSQVNPLPLSDPSAHVSACSGFAQRKRGRMRALVLEQQDSWTRLSPCSFMQQGPWPLCPPRLQGDEWKECRNFR